jgi:hypothetical protein
VNHLIQGRVSPFTYMAVVAALLLASSLPALAQGAGYDLFQTGANASVDLSSIGLGVVPLQGVPIQSATGVADTIMYRPEAVPSGGGVIPVYVFALFMESQNPVTFNGQSTDIYVTVNASNGVIPTSVLPQPDSLPASSGTITVYPNTGTFDSSITVNADLIFMPHGVSPTNSSAMLAHQAATPITMSQTGSSYTTSPASDVSASRVPEHGAAPDVVTIVTGGGGGGGGGGGASPTPTPSPTPVPTPTPYLSGGFYPRPVHQGPHPVTIVILPGGCAVAAPVNGSKTSNSKDGKSVTAQPNCVIESTE